MYSSRIINVLETVFLHTFLKKDLTWSTRNWLDEVKRIWAWKPHYIHISTSQLWDISYLFHNILLGVDTRLRISWAAATRPVAICCGCQDLATHHHHCDMQTLALLVTDCQVRRSRIVQELLQNTSLWTMNCRSHYCLLEGDWWLC